MSRDELVKRLFVAHAHLDRKFTEKFMRNGYFSDHERDFVIPKIAGELRHVPVMLDATAGLKIADFKARSRRAKVQTEGRLGLIVVDYLQLMKSSRREAQENRQAEIGEASLACKEIAKELNVPVIALAQLNRDTEKRAMHVPKLSDLRESGSIENDADFVGLLYRKYLYTKEPEDEGSATIMVQKHRNGPVGDVAMAFPEGAMRFENLALDDGRERPQWSNDPSKRQKRK